MAMNFIEKVRADIKREFSENTVQKTYSETVFSPSGNFRLDVGTFSIENSNQELTNVQIFDQAGNELFNFFVNDGTFFYNWVNTHKSEYLICAEDIFGGQTVVDLTNRKINGYSPGEDGFIWCGFYLSPDGNILATIGCYWACPSVIKLFDFSDPLKLPLREIKEIELLDNDEVITGWLDNETLQMKGVLREREAEYSENGSFRMKVIKETNLERLVKVS